MHGAKPVMIAEETLIIAGTTPATTNIYLGGVNQAGYVWVKLQTITATTGLAAVDVTWQPMGFKKGIVGSDGTNLSLSGSATTLKTGADLQSVGDFMQYSINNSAAINAAAEVFMHADGIQISLTGDALDAGTVWCSVWTWSY